MAGLQCHKSLWWRVHDSAAPELVFDATVLAAFDREHKSSLYARAQLPEYWLVNLVDRVLEVYRDPFPSADAPYGWRFTTRLRLGAADAVSPLAAPHAHIPVSDLLP